MQASVAHRVAATAHGGDFLKPSMQSVISIKLAKPPAAKAETKSDGYVKWFEEITIEDIPLVGGKNASLGEMYRELVPKGVKMPNGFAVTAAAYPASSAKLNWTRTSCARRISAETRAAPSRAAQNSNTER
jgi:hypothetical protein